VDRTCPPTCLHVAGEHLQNIPERQEWVAKTRESVALPDRHDEFGVCRLCSPGELTQQTRLAPTRLTCDETNCGAALQSVAQGTSQPSKLGFPTHDMRRLLRMLLGAGEERRRPNG